MIKRIAGNDGRKMGFGEVEEIWRGRFMDFPYVRRTSVAYSVAYSMIPNMKIWNTYFFN